MTDISLADTAGLINPHSTPRVYIACLTSHSKGEEHGVWVNANQSVAALETAAQRMLASSPAGAEAMHWTILKAEGFKPLIIKPFTPLEVIANTAAFLTQYGRLGTAVIKHLSDDVDANVLKKAQYLITHGYHGIYPSKLAFVEHFFPVTLPPSLRMEPEALHKLITDHLFIAYFFTLKIGEQLHVFSYLEYIKTNPLH